MSREQQDRSVVEHGWPMIRANGKPFCPLGQMNAKEAMFKSANQRKGYGT